MVKGSSSTELCRIQHRLRQGVVQCDNYYRYCKIFIIAVLW